MKNITILWWFWCWNLGDDTILFSEINILKKKFPESIITIFSWNPELTRKNFPLIKSIQLPPIIWYRFYKFLNVFYFYKVIKLLKETDIFILWGWWFFSDRQYFAINWWLRYCRIAKFYWAKIIWLWMWAWPFFHERNKKIINKSKNIFANVFLRDEESLDNFISTWFSRQKLIKTIDLAFFIKKESVIKDNSIWFIINSNEEYFIKEIKNILDNTDYLIKLIITDSIDLILNKKIKEIIWDKRIVICTFNSPISLIKEIWKCDFIVSQRLHWSIISFTQNIPFINIYYHHKGKELIRLLDIDDYSFCNKELANVKIIDFLEIKNNFIFEKLDLGYYKNEMLWKIN